MRRVILAVVAAVVVIIVVVGLALSKADAKSFKSVLPPVKPSVVPTASLAQINTYLASVKADGGSSTLLPNGKVFWLFGDTTNCPGGWCRNSYGIQTGSGFVHHYVELKPSDATYWYWPGFAVMNSGNLVVSWAKMTKTGSGAFDFKQVATVVTTYNYSTLAVISEVTSTYANTITSAVHAGSYWYIYSSHAVDSYHKQIDIAKSTSLNPATWSFTKLLDGSWGAGTAVSVYKNAGGYRLYTKHLDLLGTTIDSGDSLSPSGPFSAAVSRYTTPAPDGSWSYNVMVHPEQVAPSGKVVVTYALNGGSNSTNYHCYATTLSR